MVHTVQRSFWSYKSHLIQNDGHFGDHSPFDGTLIEIIFPWAENLNGPVFIRLSPYENRPKRLYL